MATLEQRFEWLKEVLNEKPQRFADYYKDDVANYLDIDELKAENLQDFFGRKFEKFNNCESKVEVGEFVDKITGYIVMKAQIEEIIDEYFS